MIVATRVRAVCGGLLIGAGLLVGLALAPPAQAGRATPVLATKVIGHSVQGRPIVAYRLGDPSARRTALIVGQMHGDEHAGVTLANSIVDGVDSVEDIDLWVIPTMNPDGDAAHTRQNAHGVDLNRNWPDKWAHLSGDYYSGTRPRSEPETRAMYRFLDRRRPQYVVVLHQPLDGVDTTDGGALDVAFRNELARRLDLPKKAFRCWSVCQGSMTGWYTTHHYGIAETIEFGSHPSRSYLTGQARRGIVKALGGHFGRLARHDPRVALDATPSAEAVVLTGWAYDPDKPGTRLRIRVDESGATLAWRWARRPSPALNERRDLSGGHAFRVRVTAEPGRHEYCVRAANLAAGERRTRCTSVVVHAST